MSAPVAQRSFVYFITCGKYVKIGYSYNPALRIKSLTSEVRGCRGVAPDDIDRTRPLEIVHTIGGCRMRDERILHDVFSEHRVAGEWFRYSLAFQRQLGALNYETCRQREIRERRERAALKRARLRAGAKRAA